MQVVEHGDVAPQRVLVAVEFEADAVDLPGHVLELFLEAFEPRLERAEQAAQEPLVLERGRIEVLGLEDDVGQELAGVAEILLRTWPRILSA